MNLRRFSRCAFTFGFAGIVAMIAGCNSDFLGWGDSQRLGLSASQIRDLTVASSLEGLETQIETEHRQTMSRKLLDDFREDVGSLFRKAKSDGDRAVYALNGFIFNTLELEFCVEGTSSVTEKGHYAVPHSKAYGVLVDLARQLRARGIDLIVVPIPARAEVYPEALSTRVGKYVGVNSLRIAFIRELLRADVEAIDLLPFLEAAKNNTSTSRIEPLYHREDMHYSVAGIRVVARVIAERLRRYDFTNDSIDAKVEYSINSFASSAFSSYEEDISAKKTPRDRQWNFDQVIDVNGNAFEPEDESPVLILGDSFVGHPARHVSGTNITAHLSKELGMRVSQQWQAQNAPRMNLALARWGSRYVDSRRVIVVLFAARSLRPEVDDRWKKIKLP